MIASSSKKDGKRMLVFNDVVVNVFHYADENYALVYEELRERTMRELSALKIFRNR